MIAADIVYQGGGFKGAIEGGCTKALEVGGYRFRRPAGVSIGAANAAAYAAGGSQLQHDLWHRVKEKDVVTKYGALRIGWRVATGADGIYDFAGYLKFIRRELGGDGPYGDAMVGRVSVTTGRWDFCQATAVTVYASGVMPVYAAPVKDIDPKTGYPDYWLDGGIRHTTPLADAIDRGAERIVVILSNPLDMLAVACPKGVLKLAVRSLEILMHQISVADIRETRRVNDLVAANAKLGITVCSPKGVPYRHVPLEVYAPLPTDPIGETLDGDHDLMLRRWELGEQIAERGPVE